MTSIFVRVYLPLFTLLAVNWLYQIRACNLLIHTQIKACLPLRRGAAVLFARGSGPLSPGWMGLRSKSTAGFKPLREGRAKHKISVTRRHWLENWVMRLPSSDAGC